MGAELLTILVSGAGDQDEYNKTVNSVREQINAFGEKVVIIPIPDRDADWNNRQQEKAKIRTKYVMFVPAGTTFFKTALERGYRAFEENGDLADAVMLRASYSSRPNMPSDKSAPLKIYDLEKREDLTGFPEIHEGVILRTEMVQQLDFDVDCQYEIWEDYLCKIMDHKRKMVFVQDGICMLTHAPKMNDAYNKDNLQKDWYFAFAQSYLTHTIQYYQEKYHRVPLFVQYQMLYQMKARFEANRNHKVKRTLNDEEVSAFMQLCAEALQYIETECLRPWELPQQRSVRVNYGLSKRLLGLKTGIMPETDIFACVPTVYLDLMNDEDTEFRFDFSVAGLYWNQTDRGIRCKLNGKTYPVEETIRYTKEDYFDQEYYRAFTFCVRIPYEKLGRHNVIAFEMYNSVDGKEQITQLQLSTQRFTSRITPVVRYSYWTSGRFMIHFTDTSVKKELLIERAGRIRRMKQEIHLLYAMWSGPGHVRRLTIQRMKYWLSYPKYHRKNIWLAFDKNYKAGDNGEYFYKYCCTRKDTDVIPAYLINADAPDRKRLEEEGYKPLIYGSEKHRLMFLHAKMIFATHAGIYNFNHISERELPYLQDLMRADSICIQHGLTVQNLAHNANRAFLNNKVYYCASKYEVRNLLQPQYGYDDPSAIRLVGLARFDGLVNDDKRQILITPTWRTYLALPQAEKNQQVPYFPGFKDTEYFKIYNELLSDQKLLESARRNHYRLVYLIHPSVACQICDYDVREGVDIISAIDVNYEKILKESSLMVTDYSGIQFDFAYMRKPLVYYHHPKLPPHYMEGGFFYDTQAFGEICTEHHEIVDLLCEYMDHECQLKPAFREREDDFFAFDDHENCKRIFDDAYAYQKEKCRRRK